MDILIQEAVPSDFPAIAALSRTPLGYENCSAEGVKAAWERMQKTGGKVFVAKFHDQTVGYAQCMEYLPLYGKASLFLVALSVSQNCHRMGIGRKLLKAVEEYGRSLSFETVSLISNFVRKDAHQFYEAMGYRMEKEEKFFIKDI